MKITKSTILDTLNEAWDALDHDQNERENHPREEQANIDHIVRCKKRIDLMHDALRDNPALLDFVLVEMTARDVAHG
jgi:hypothetical protein